MDEGFTSYGSAVTGAFLADRKASFERSIRRYASLHESGKQEPLTTHSDHYNTNRAYSTAAYTIGSLVPYQLSYIMGQETFDAAFRAYYDKWQFHHPEPTDFEKVMEDESGMVLDWFFLDWIGTTKVLDYAVKSVEEESGKVKITLENKNERPMPTELLVTYKDGSKERFYIPLRLMRGSKAFQDQVKTTELAAWPWTHPTYSFTLERAINEIESVDLDPDMGMVDIDYSNNYWTNN
jgi:aminopeptidase N